MHGIALLVFLFSTAMSSIAEPEKATENDIPRLVKEFRNLRAKPGHFNAGEWNDDRDRWGGKLHGVMSDLGRLLGNSRYRKADIRRLLGKPDKIIVKDGSEESLAHYASIGKPYSPQSRNLKEEHLIYCWRGYHDYLYFICSNSVIKEAKWYFALE